MHLSDWKAWSQHPLLLRPQLKAGSGGKSILLEIPVYLSGGGFRRFWEVSRFFFLFLCLWILYLSKSLVAAT